MRRLLLVPMDTGRAIEAHTPGEAPRLDFVELATALDADTLSWTDVDASRRPLVRLIAKLAGSNAALAWMGWRRRSGTVFTTAENVGMPFALLHRCARRGRQHVMIAHMISAPKKVPVFKRLKLARGIDGIIAYSSQQTRFAEEQLGVEARRLHRIHFHCDQQFFKPVDALAVPVPERAGVVAVGRELRDYPTLIEAARGLDAQVTIVGGSLWSKREDQLAGAELPENVTLRSGLSYEELRDLYTSAELAVVPLQDVDSPAGVTSIFEALATCTPVVVSQTPGIADSVQACRGVIRVPQGDPVALWAAMRDLLADPVAREERGRWGRAAIENDRSLDVFVQRITSIIEETETMQTVSVSRGLFAGRSVRQLFASVLPVLAARFWLRGFQRVGSRVRTYGRPRVTNLGRMEIGDRCTIFSQTVRSEFVTHENGRIEIGDGVFINYGASISAHDRVAIGDGSQIGSYAILMDNDYHTVGQLDAQPASVPIVLGRNVWLGVRVTILKGVTVGDNSVIGAGSVVTKDVPANCLVAGVPARLVRRFDPEHEGRKVPEEALVEPAAGTATGSAPGSTTGPTTSSTTGPTTSSTISTVSDSSRGASLDEPTDEPIVGV
jgi:acetyltransferase-like isoleucine patch superfamily enzyme